MNPNPLMQPPFDVAPDVDAQGERWRRYNVSVATGDCTGEADATAGTPPVAGPWERTAFEMAGVLGRWVRRSVDGRTLAMVEGRRIGDRDRWLFSVGPHVPRELRIFGEAPTSEVATAIADYVLSLRGAL